MLNMDRLLEGATHGSHLAGAAVTVSIGAAHGVGGQLAGLGALAHGFVVLDHAHCPVFAHLIQARTRRVEI